MKKFKYIFLILIITSILWGCENGNDNINIDLKVNKDNDVILNIMTTDKMLFYMTKDVVGDKHLVEFMFRNREEELNYSFSEDAISNISKYDLFIYNGEGLEPWASDFVGKLSKGKLGIINLSRGINILSYSSNIKYKGYIFKENPYYWMNIDNYKIALLNIKNAIQDKDPKNREFYEKNFNDTLKDLDDYEKIMKEISSAFKDLDTYYVEEDLEYFLKYLNIKSVKLEEDKKFEISKEKFFFYYDEKKLEEMKDAINKYNLVPVKILIHKEDAKYIDIVKLNLDVLSKIVPAKEEKK
ncbi:metal ABC transporter substrate-binding protein [Clostridium malenominatum]|uniref:Metal ABC transporter substrate-binding protein n=1 Tax=Clostridium malenominatum TaxID=1539 RepID=A0ABN1IMJ2_9CLOT